MADVSRNPKVLIHELFKKQIGNPTFSTDKDSVHPGSTYTASLELPAIPGFFERVKFSGKGRSKKLAEQTAAEVAVAWIQKKAPGLIPRQAGPAIGTSLNNAEKVRPQTMIFLMSNQAGLRLPRSPR